MIPIIMLCIFAVTSLLLNSHLRHRMECELDRAPKLCPFLDEHLRQKNDIEKNELHFHSCMYVIAHYVYAILHGKQCVVFTAWPEIRMYATHMADICKAEKIDVLIGILSGGAYLSQLCSQKCGIPVYYAKVIMKKRAMIQKCILAAFTKTRAADRNVSKKQRSVPVFISSTFGTVDTDPHTESYFSIQGPRSNIQDFMDLQKVLMGKRVALIDDGVLCGDTMRAVQIHVQNHGAASVLPLALHGYVDANVRYISKKILCYGPFGYL